MTSRSRTIALERLRSLFAAGGAVGLTDGQLLERFATGGAERAESAFSALVERHGPMVLGVCRSVLRDEHRAHDAFQATFLVLARKANSLRGDGSLAPWLHLVARRIAVRAMAAECRRRAAERGAAEWRAAEMARRHAIGERGEDLGPILHEEIDRLPGRYRRPVVLCDLEGRSYEEAAASLGCPIGTIKSRLARGRGLLRDRLLRRGVTPVLAGSVAAACGEASGAVPPELARDTVRVALAHATGRAATLGTTVAALAEGEIRSMVLFKLTTAGLVLLASGVLTTGLLALGPPPREEPVESRPAEPDVPQRPAAEGPPAAEEPPVVEGPSADAVGRFAERLVKDPVIRPDGTFRYRLFLTEVATGKTTAVVDEPGNGHAYCGSPCWSKDGRTILFDATPLSEWTLSRLMAIRLDDGPPRVTHLGLGNCPSSSPDGRRIAFLSNASDAETGVYVMNADGSDRARLGPYGRPKWSPDGRQILISDFSDPCQVSLWDVEAARERPVRLPDHRIFSIPNWADAGTIVAVIGAGAADAIALIDVTDPAEAKLEAILWERGRGPDVIPAGPVYDARTRRCVFVGKGPKGMALYTFEARGTPRPERLERGPLDHAMGDLALSPDGRFVLFNSDRADPPPR